MTAAATMPETIRLNPDWRGLQLFDREGWRRMAFGAFADNVNERVEPADAASDIYIGLDDLDSGNLHITRWGKGSDVIGTKLRFRKGDVIFGRRRAYQRKLAVAEVDGICSAHAMVVRAKPNVVLSEFLPFLMMGDRFMKRAQEISVGSLSPTINWTTLKLEEFDIPPLGLQRRIVQPLWAADSVSEASLREEADLGAYKRSVWKDHVSRPMVRTVPIGEVADVLNGSTPSKAEERFWRNGTIPWLPTGKVHDRFIHSADEFITEVAIKEKKARVFPKGSVLVAMIGQGKTRGSAALLEMDSSINQNFACCVPHGINSDFLFYALDFSYEALRRSSHGSNQEALNCGLVSRFQVPLPGREEQEKLAAMMRESERVLTNIQHHRDLTQRLVLDFVNALLP